MGRLDDYELLDHAGAGAQAAVWRARHRPTGATVAVKRVSVAALSEKQRDAAQREAAVLEQLAAAPHPGLSALRESFMDGSELVLVLDWCGGGTLASLMETAIRPRQRGGPAATGPPEPPTGGAAGGGADLTEELVWHVLLSLCGALAHCHARGILHRDVKPANVFLSSDPPPPRPDTATACGAGAAAAQRLLLRRDSAADPAKAAVAAAAAAGAFPRVVLGDFGVATVLDDRTRAVTLVGTPYYLSPEMCQGEAYGPACDMWALGVVLFQLLNGCLPYQGANYGMLILSIVQGTPQRQAAIFSPPLHRLAAALLAKSPTARPSARAILDSAPARAAAARILAAAGLPVEAPEHPPAVPPCGGAAALRSVRGSVGGSSGIDVPLPAAAMAKSFPAPAARVTAASWETGDEPGPSPAAVGAIGGGGGSVRPGTMRVRRNVSGAVHSRRVRPGAPPPRPGTQSGLAGRASRAAPRVATATGATRPPAAGAAGRPCAGRQSAERDCPLAAPLPAAAMDPEEVARDAAAVAALPAYSSASSDADGPAEPDSTPADADRPSPPDAPDAAASASSPLFTEPSPGPWAAELEAAIDPLSAAGQNVSAAAALAPAQAIVAAGGSRASGACSSDVGIVRADGSDGGDEPAELPAAGPAVSWSVDGLGGTADGGIAGSPLAAPHCRTGPDGDGGGGGSGFGSGGAAGGGSAGTSFEASFAQPLARRRYSPGAAEAADPAQSDSPAACASAGVEEPRLWGGPPSAFVAVASLASTALPAEAPPPGPSAGAWASNDAELLLAADDGAATLPVETFATAGEMSASMAALRREAAAVVPLPAFDAVVEALSAGASNAEVLRCIAAASPPGRDGDVFYMAFRFVYLQAEAARLREAASAAADRLRRLRRPMRDERLRAAAAAEGDHPGSADRRMADLPE